MGSPPRLGTTRSTWGRCCSAPKPRAMRSPRCRFSPRSRRWCYCGAVADPKRLVDLLTTFHPKLRLPEPPCGVLGRPGSAATWAPCVLAWRPLDLAFPGKRCESGPLGGPHRGQAYRPPREDFTLSLSRLSSLTLTGGNPRRQRRLDPQQPRWPSGQPPVPAPHEGDHGRDDERPDNGGVQKDSRRQAGGHHLDVGLGSRGHRGEREEQDERGAGHEPPGSADALHDRGLGGAGAVVLLAPP